MKTLFFSFCMLSFMLLVACSSSKLSSAGSANDKSGPSDQVENVSMAVDLAEYLKGVPGVTVSGSGSTARAIIRGVSSINYDSDPLFVINGTPISGGLSAANNMVPVTNIKSLRVLKSPSETTMYGVRGASGVIVIQLK